MSITKCEEIQQLFTCTEGFLSPKDLKSLMDRLKVADSERNLLHKKLFGAEGMEAGLQPNMADVLHKVESLFQERDGLVSDHTHLIHSVENVWMCVWIRCWRSKHCRAALTSWTRTGSLTWSRESRTSWWKETHSMLTASSKRRNSPHLGQHQCID